MRRQDAYVASRLGVLHAHLPRLQVHIDDPATPSPRAAGHTLSTHAVPRTDAAVPPSSMVAGVPALLTPPVLFSRPTSRAACWPIVEGLCKGARRRLVPLSALVHLLGTERAASNHHLHRTTPDPPPSQMGTRQDNATTTPPVKSASGSQRHQSVTGHVSTLRFPVPLDGLWNRCL